MKQWIKANPKSRAAKLALDADGNVDLSKISDTEKIQFTKNLNLGNIDFFNKPEAPVNKGVPIFDEDGLVGFENTKKFEKDMGGQEIRTGTTLGPKLDALMKEQEALGNPMGANYPRELLNRAKFGSEFRPLKEEITSLKPESLDFSPALPPTESPVSSFEPSQKMVSQDMLDRNNQEVNSVLDSVPFPRPKSPAAPRPKPRNPVTTLPFSLEQPVSKEPGVELTRTSKEYPTMDAPKYPSSNQPGMELTRTSPERPTMDVPAAQYRKQTPGFGRSGKKQINIPQLDRLDMDNYDYRPNAPKHPGGAGMGRSGKKQYNIPALDFLDLDNYFYNQ